ncbi:MAG: hypothetical protein Q9173_007002 [Seirophora scorigena]
MDYTVCKGKAAVLYDRFFAEVSDLAQALEGKDVKELLLNVGSGGGATAAPTGGAGAAPTEVPVDEAKDEKKEEEKEESDEDMGFGLFD